MILRRALPCIVLVILAATAIAQSNRGTAEATVKGKKISIKYGRPMLKGRDLLSLAPVGTVWRLGMNNATEIDTAADLTVAGKDVKAGQYTLWAKKTGADSWTLAFHPTTGVWGMPVLKEGYVAELPLKLSTATASVEQFTISLADSSGSAAIKIEWGTMVLTGVAGVK